ncbi:translation initiation factor IF-2 subunit alpha [Candidatus Micrarchaeota archaeon]|nr:translation initiation factor IF-2 subunit alpha [Candidatus Micrarchaeota archaeon]
MEEKSAGNTGRKMPELDEYVIATVRKIFPYGAFCSLDEYDGMEAFVHVSEVAPRWIKNIHEFLRDGQKIVAKVYRYVPEKNLIDLSIKRVNEADKKRKLEGTQRRKRGEKLLELAAKRAGLKKEDAEKIAEQMKKNFEDVLAALEEISFNPKDAFEKLDLTEKWKGVLQEVATQNIKKQRMNVGGILKATCYASDGVEKIKEALKHAKETGAGKKGVEVKVIYLGAPNYKVDVEADDYKNAEAVLEAFVKRMEEKLKKNGAVEFLKAT